MLKAMLAKGSVKFGLGMKLGRMEGAKEARSHSRRSIPPRTPGAEPPCYLCVADPGLARDVNSCWGTTRLVRYFAKLNERSSNPLRIRSTIS